MTDAGAVSERAQLAFRVIDMGIPFLRWRIGVVKGMLWQRQSLGAVGADDGDGVAADEVGC